MGRPTGVVQMLPRLKRIVRRFWPFLQKQKTLLSGSMLALLAEVVFRVLEPWPLKFVIDRVIGSRGDTGLISGSLLNGFNANAVLVGAVSAQIAVTGLRALSSYYGTVGFALAGQRIMADVRAHLYRHLQLLSLAFHNQARSGDLVVRVIGDIGMLRDVIVTALLPLLVKTLILAAMMGLMFWLSWTLALVALIPLPLFWFRTVRLSRRIHQVARVQRRRQGAMAATAAESFGAMRTVQALSLEDQFAESFISQNRKSVRDGAKAKRLAARLERFSDVIQSVSTALVLFFAAFMVRNGQLSVGDLLVFLYYVKHAFRPVRDFAKYTGRLAKATAAGERVLEVMERSPEVQDRPGAIQAPDFKGSLSFDHVGFQYTDDRQVLRDICLSVNPGQLLALTGPSGGGKTTLASLLLRLFDPSEGRVTIDGRDVRDYTVDSLRSQISTVLQDNLLFSGTIRENIAGGKADATDQELQAATEIAGAHTFIASLAEGYETRVGERGVTLSHGQRQRIAIARAAVRRAPILILDEPTTGLDDENARHVCKAIERLSGRCTTILITHDLRLAQQADVVAYIEDGELVEFGSHRTLKSAGGAYSNLLTRMATIWSDPKRAAEA